MIGVFCYTGKTMTDNTTYPKSKQSQKAGKFTEVVLDMQKKRSKILQIAKRFPTPFYLIDDRALQDAISQFQSAFRRALLRSKFFYAIKSNYHEHILKAVVRHGWGLDASSGRELGLALNAGAKQILFTGPGKTEDELRLTLKHADKVILNIDNFSELERLSKLLKGKNIKLRAGVRFFSKHHGQWSKFGIPLADLAAFWSAASKIKNLDLQGIQFHSSNNLTAERNVKIIAELGKYLRMHFSASQLRQIKYIDLGGGYFPDQVEGVYLKRGRAVTRAESPEQFAKSLREAIKKNLDPILTAEYYFEPGRIISTRAMHLVLRIVDVKKGLAITDGGINMMGWEFGKEFYLPIFNLTNFSRAELNFPIYGSLCTPRDIWGHYIHGKKITSGDVLVIPNQGAYRYTLAQEFIKPIPETRFLN